MIYVMTFTTKDSVSSGDRVLIGTAEWIHQSRSTLKKSGKRMPRRFACGRCLGMLDGSEDFATSIRETFRSPEVDDKPGRVAFVMMTKELDEWIRINLRAWDGSNNKLMGINATEVAKAAQERRSNASVKECVSAYKKGREDRFAPIGSFADRLSRRKVNSSN